MKPVVLCILDGLGINKREDYNAVYSANKPNLDKIMKEYPFVEGKASGLDVGLPEGQMGNSEVGHLNIGAGRIIYQELTRITKSIEDGDFFEVEEFLTAIDNCKKNNSALHLCGLLSSGGVHSHNTHLYGLLKLAKMHNLEKVYVHAFLDGRDTAPTSGKNFVQELEDKMNEIGVGKIATVIGRYYAMDRDNRWERVEKAYLAMTEGIGEEFDSGVKGIEKSYSENITDEFVVPFIVKNTEDTKIKDGDSMIFFNYRPDRARELTKAFCLNEFDGFNRRKKLDLVYVCFTEYDENIPNKIIAFKKEEIVDTLGSILEKNNLTELRLAETEKYPHVTFFFNGGIEEPFNGEDRILVNSPRDVATYDLKPEMSAIEVGENLCNAIRSKKYDVIIVNFANPDMVGHTGNLEAAKKAVETVDKCLGDAIEALKEVNGAMFVCADHGNCEQLKDYETGEPFTAHTTNPVPFILVNGPKEVVLKENGRLCDIAPTMLELLEIEKPEKMTGESLLLKR